MKKQWIFPLAASLLALAACGPAAPEASSSSKGEEPSSSQGEPASSNGDSLSDRGEETEDSSSTSYIPPIDTNSGDKAQIYTTLVAAAEGGNYTVSYDLEKDGTTTRVEDAVTTNYIPRAYGEGGYILLSSYNEEYGKNIYYSYKRNGNSITVLNAVKTTESTSVSPKPANQEDDWLYLNPLGNIADPENRVTENFISFDASNGIYTEQQAFIVSLGRALGYRSMAMTGRIAQVRFALEKDGSVRFDLMKWKDALDDDNEEIETFATGYISKVGQTKDDVLDEFRSSFALPKEQIPEGASAYFDSGKANATTEVTLHDGGKETWKASIDLQTEENARKVNTRRDNPHGILDDAEFIRKAASGYAERVYINGENQIATERLDYLWGQDSYHTADEYFDLTAFRKTSDGTYHYYGPAAEGIFDALTTYSLYFGSVESIDAKYGDDGFFLSGVSASDSTGAYHSFETTVRMPSKITLDTIPVDTTSADYQKLSTAFAVFQDSSTSFHAVETKNGNVDSMTEEQRQVGDYYRFGDYGLFLNADLTRPSWGYKAKEGGVQPFAMSFTYHYTDDDNESDTWHYEGTTSPKGALLEDKTLADMMGFCSHPELFVSVGNNKYAAKAYVDGIGKVMFPEGDDDARDYDTYFTLGEDGRIASYEYWSPTNGYRKLVFDYEAPTLNGSVLTFRTKQTLDLSGIDKIPFTTWESGYAWFYTYQLIRLYRDTLGMSQAEAKAAADTVPYLSDDTFVRYAFDVVTAEGTTVGLYSKSGTPNSRKIYANKYKAYLLQCGYELKTDSSNKEYYAGEYCDIYVGSDLSVSGKGFTFSLHKAAA